MQSAERKECRVQNYMRLRRDRPPGLSAKNEQIFVHKTSTGRGVPWGSRKQTHIAKQTINPQKFDSVLRNFRMTYRDFVCFLSTYVI